MVIVDFRNIAKIASYSILSGSVACCFPTEAEEISHRIAKRLYCIRLDYPDEQLIFANDRSPYWRSAYLNKWYSDRGLEPIGYKANREGMSWPFADSKERINEVYDAVEQLMSGALCATIVEDRGLEADDIWALLAATATEPIIGISSDSDWRQLCGPLVTIVDPTTALTYKEPSDIRPKLMAGDRGDNVQGCNKRKKDGSLGSTMWGIDGAEKVLLLNDLKELPIDQDVVERNRVVIQLPTPIWDVKQARLSLNSCFIEPKECDNKAILDQFGITVNVRKLLSDKAERDAWIEKLRAKLQVMNKEVKK